MIACICEDDDTIVFFQKNMCMISDEKSGGEYYKYAQKII